MASWETLPDGDLWMLYRYRATGSFKIKINERGARGAMWLRYTASGLKCLPAAPAKILQPNQRTQKDLRRLLLRGRSDIPIPKVLPG